MTTAEEYIRDLFAVVDNGINLVDELVTKITKSSDEYDDYYDENTSL